MKKITMQQLKDLKACQSDLDVLEQMPSEEGWEMTLEFIESHYHYNWSWLGKNILNKDSQKEFIDKRKEFFNQYKQEIKGKKLKSEKEPVRNNLLKNIAVLFYKIYNGVEE